MIVEALRGQEVEVIIVDHCAEQIKTHLTSLGLGSKVTHCYDGSGCVKNFAQWYRDEQAKQVVERLRMLWAAGDLYLGGTPKASRGPKNGEMDLQGQVTVRWGDCDRIECRGHRGSNWHLHFTDLKSLQRASEGDLQVPLFPDGAKHMADQSEVPTLLWLR